MSIIDKNKIFFGLVHYILSEQSNVNWLFKTSYIKYLASQQNLEDNNIQFNVLNNIKEYINDVKPYHTKLLDTLEKYNTDIDNSNVNVLDEIKTKNYFRYDATTPDVSPEEIAEYERGETLSKKWLTTTMADRLYYYKTKNISDIRDYMNCNYKGIEVEGQKFDNEVFGWDSCLYDSTKYDSPQITYRYCLVNLTEAFVDREINNDPNDYRIIIANRKFYPKGITAFKVDSQHIISKNNTRLFHIQGYNSTEIFDYSLDNNILTIFETLDNYEELVLKEFDANLDLLDAFIFQCNPFSLEVEKNPETAFFTQLENQNLLTIPQAEFQFDKVIVTKQNKDEEQTPFTNYQLLDNNVKIISPNINDIFNISVVDMKFLYDKIYHWEDKWGFADNISPVYVPEIIGGDFSQPEYAKNHPEEYVGVYPTNSLFIYEKVNDTQTNIKYIDYKDKDIEFTINPTLVPTIVAHDFNDGLGNRGFNLGDSVIYVSSVATLSKPYIENEINIPGKILINSEIIEYFEVDENNNTLTSLRRACNGTNLTLNHNVGELVIPFIDTEIRNVTEPRYSISHIIKNINLKTYEAPFTSYKNPNLIVAYKGIGTLLSDIKSDSTYFDVGYITTGNDPAIIDMPGNIILKSKSATSFQFVTKAALNIICNGITYTFNFPRGGYSLLDIQNIFNTGSHSFKCILNDDNTFSLVSFNGKVLTLSNKISTPLNILFNLNETTTVTEPTKLGRIILNDDIIFFKNVLTLSDGNKYRISNFEYTVDHTIGETFMMANTMIVPQTDYTINYSNASQTNWQANVSYKAGDYVLVNNISYKCILGHVSSAPFQLFEPTPSTYSSNIVYNIGDKVKYRNKWYVCNENNVTGTWDKEKWDLYIPVQYWEEATPSIESVTFTKSLIKDEIYTIIISNAQ